METNTTIASLLLLGSLLTRGPEHIQTYLHILICDNTLHPLTNNNGRYGATVVACVHGIVMLYVRRQEQALGAIYFSTEWWVERGLQRLGGLPGTNLSRKVPEIVLANSHLLDDRVSQLVGEVRDIHQLALGIQQSERNVGIRDDTSKGIHLAGAPSHSRSTLFSHHFASAEIRVLALQALRAECAPGQSLPSTDDMEVHVFSSASVGGELVTSLQYTRSTERCAYNVVLQAPNTLGNSSPSSEQVSTNPPMESKYATVIHFYMVRHRTTLSVLGRMALVSCYTQVVPTTTTVSGVVHLRVNRDNGNMLVPLFAICATCLIHKCEDTIQAVELWGKGKVLY